MPFGIGTRPWMRGSEAARAANTTVLPWGELVVTNEGKVYASDGTSQIKNLIAPPSSTDLTTAVNGVTVRLLTVATTLVASGQINGGQHTPCDATNGAINITLPNATVSGQLVSFSKYDSSANAVTLTTNLRGVANATLALSYQYESIVMVSKADGSWWPIGGHRTKSSLDAVYLGVSAPTASKNMARDASGRAQVVDPSVAADIATKGYVDTAVSGAAATTSLLKANNLSDLTNVPTARTNLGLGSAAVRPDSDFQRRSPFRRNTAVAETIPRAGSTLVLNSAVLLTGQESAFAITLLAGQVISKATFMAGSTAAASPTNQWFGLRDASFNLLRVTNDDTTTAWAANTEKQLTFASTYTVPSDGIYYMTLMVAATTVPTIVASATTAVINNLAPIVATRGTTTGLTTPSTAPATLTTSGLAFSAWAWLA